MTPEQYNNFDKIEGQNISDINIDAVSFNFCSDSFIQNIHKKRISELEDKHKWIQEHEKDFELEKDKIEKLLKNGLIQDTNPNTLWKFRLDMERKNLEKLLDLKVNLESSIAEIRLAVSEMLSKFLPSWNAKNAKIVFTLNENADYCIEENIITVDLLRLLNKKDPIKDVIHGLAHEIFHLWMSSDTDILNSDEDLISNNEFKNKVIFATIGEGIAVFVGGQSLSDYHKDKGLDFEKYKEESFNIFNSFLRSEDRGYMNEIAIDAFKNMGHFYVVGYEIVNSVFNHYGLDALKKMIIEAPKNPAIFLEKYNAI